MSIPTQKPKTIAIDARMYGAGQTGIGNYIYHLMKYLFEIDEKNNYLVFLLPEEFDKFKLPNERVKKIKVIAKWYGYKEQFLLPVELYKEKLDLIHFTHFNSPILYFKKSIVTIHDTIPIYFPGHKMKSLWRRTCSQAVFFSSVKKAKNIIAVSKSTKNDIVKHFGIKENKIEVIYEGVDREFRVVEDYGKIKAIKEKYKITRPFIFYTGVWRNHKNLVGLVKAFDLIVNKYRLDYQLVLGGKEDPYYPEVRRTWEKLNLGDQIIRAGFINQEELSLFYNAADIFVIPSFREGFGLIGLEAMACGTPVISSNKTCLPEILGGAAVYFNPDDYQEMAEKIASVIQNENLKNDLIQKGFEQIKKYNWRRMAEETLKIYEKILFE